MYINIGMYPYRCIRAWLIIGMYHYDMFGDERSDSRGYQRGLLIG